MSGETRRSQTGATTIVVILFLQTSLVRRIAACSLLVSGVALLGDAAATSDPSFGQGMSLTLRDARARFFGGA